VVSVHDPEMRQGCKSATRRIEGHQGAMAVDLDSQLITAALVLPGNAQDHEQALELVEQTEAKAAIEVEETVGDCAFDDSETRHGFADAERKLVAKVPQRRSQVHFPQEDFQIDLQTMTCPCPGGQACRTVVSILRRPCSRRHAHSSGARPLPPIVNCGRLLSIGWRD
jgi:hypothetical protein